MTNEPVDVGNLIDLERYPIDALDTDRGRRIVTRFADALGSEGMCRLDGFLRPSAVDALCAEANALASRGSYALKECNPYFTPRNPELADDDARNIMTPRCLGMVAGDLIS